MGGTNSILAVASGSQSIYEYDIATDPNHPTLVGTIPTPGFAALRIAFSSDGSKLYAGGIVGYPTPGAVNEYNFATGQLLNSVATPNGSWGVAVDPLNGKVYWTTGWATGANGAVYSANADLSNVQQVVAPGANGATGLVGITFAPDGSFYVVNGGNGGGGYYDGFVLHYAADGTLIDRVSNVGMPAGALNNAFDTEIGPNGNLFVSSQNGACVVEFNTSNDTYNSIFIAAGLNGLATAKTIHFSVNNINTVPEPSTLVMAGIGTLGLLGYALRRGRRGLSLPYRPGPGAPTAIPEPGWLWSAVHTVRRPYTRGLEHPARSGNACPHDPPGPPRKVAGGGPGLGVKPCRLTVTFC